MSSDRRRLATAGRNSVRWVPTASTELWQRLVGTIGENINLAVPHPLDKERVIRHMRNLYRVGERPSASEMGAYLEQLWPGAPGARRLVLKVWRAILANPDHRFRDVQGWTTLSLLDGLAEELTVEHGSPPLAWRVLDVFETAQERFTRVALDDPDFEAYLAARRDLMDAVSTVRALRELRLGAKSVGDWMALPADACTPAELKEWDRLRRRYAA